MRDIERERNRDTERNGIKMKPNIYKQSNNQHDRTMIADKKKGRDVYYARTRRNVLLGRGRHQFHNKKNAA